MTRILVPNIYELSTVTLGRRTNLEFEYPTLLETGFGLVSIQPIFFQNPYNAD